MKNLLIVATSALCVLLVTAAPAADPRQTQDLEIVQIPLQGNKEIDILSLPENNEGQLTERNKRTIGILRELFPELSKMAGGNAPEQSIDLGAISERLQEINRFARAAQTSSSSSTTSTTTSGAIDPDAVATPIDKGDASPAASEQSESKSSSLDELSLSDEDNGEDRNKRFLSFGLSGGNSGSGGGGSGNFLFDIIRRTADRAARAAGTIYRVAAGTESIDSKLNKGSDSDTNNDNYDATSRKFTDGLNKNGLVGGSAGTEQTDEQENAPVDVESEGKQVDGYTEGIPGPVTRLFVLANRGIANLIQDLILRIAQTSERVVNFKARLITSLI